MASDSTTLSPGSPPGAPPGSPPGAPPGSPPGAPPGGPPAPPAPRGGGKVTRIPLFPLNIVAFPGEPLPLHIFEPRYKEMISYCLEGQPEGTSRLFGISYAHEKQLREIGCAMYVDRIITRYPDGRYDLVTVGFKRYKMKELIRDKSYYEGDMQFFDDGDGAIDTLLRERTVALHTRLVEMVKGKTPHIRTPDENRVSFYLANHAGLDNDQKQKILEMRSENERLTCLAEYYSRTIPTIMDKEDVQQRIILNGAIRKLESIEL